MPGVRDSWRMGHPSRGEMLRMPQRYWNTVRHLRAVQVYGRLWRGLWHAKVGIDRLPPVRGAKPKLWVSPVMRAPSLVGPDSFRFLNVTRDLSEVGWDNSSCERLWRYNLHYFDDLNASGADSRTRWHRALMLRWVQDNPPFAGSGWEPYPTSLRIVNWIKWAMSGNELPPDCVSSLALQARWLSSRLEHHLLGNHLLTNAKALVFAGLFFDSPESADWLDTGLRILSREFDEQILPDGGHFERSTMYHALVLEDALDLRNITRAFSSNFATKHVAGVANWSEWIDRMREWLIAMSHPDGDIAFFNDTALGVAGTPRELERYAEELGCAPLPPRTGVLQQFRESGYVRVERDGVVAILDVAPIGPDHLPAHAHADTLSFEMSLFRKRVLVNSGTSVYESGSERGRQRGTRAHNTVTINNADSSEVWGGFRVARRAKPMAVGVDAGDPLTICCSHTGYLRLRGRPVHSRQWTFGNSELVVEDTISGSFKTAEARFHLHPEIRIHAVERGSDQRGVVLLLSDGRRIDFSVEGGLVRVEESTWHPEFGRSEPNVCLAVGFGGPVLRTSFRWDGAG